MATALSAAQTQPKVWPPPIPRRLVFYPETDGEPMTETDRHRRQLLDLLFALEMFFQSAPDVYVAGNLMFYYVEGDPSQCVAPDVFVVRGVPKGDRRVYKVWEEGKAPNVVIELTSNSTRINDLGAKKGIYETLGVHEYFVFDPLVEYLKPVLQGYRLSDRGYQPLKEEPLLSQALGLELRVVEGWLRFYDRATNQLLRTPSEAAAWAQQEAQARQAAEEEIARLREELARLKQSAK
jgi:Uma2 family endonuclease